MSPQYAYQISSRTGRRHKEEGGENLYGFVNNRTIGSIDIFGFVEWDHNINQELNYPEAGIIVKNNCLGHALSGRDDVFIKPKTDGKDSLEKSLGKNGWKCTTVKDKATCKCECAQEKMLMAITQNDNPRNKGKDPFRDPTYDWSSMLNGKYVSEFHAIRGTSGCSNKYTEVPGVNKQRRNQGKTTDPYFDGRYDMLCCCKDKKSILR